MILQAEILVRANGGRKTTLYYQELEKGNTFGYCVNVDEFVSNFVD